MPQQVILTKKKCQRLLKGVLHELENVSKAPKGLPQAIHLVLDPTGYPNYQNVETERLSE